MGAVRIYDVMRFYRSCVLCVSMFVCPHPPAGPVRRSVPAAGDSFVTESPFVRSFVYHSLDEYVSRTGTEWRDRGDRMGLKTEKIGGISPS